MTKVNIENKNNKPYLRKSTEKENFEIKGVMKIKNLTSKDNILSFELDSYDLSNERLEIYMVNKNNNGNYKNLKYTLNGNQLNIDVSPLYNLDSLDESQWVLLFYIGIGEYRVTLRTNIVYANDQEINLTIKHSYKQSEDSIYYSRLYVTENKEIGFIQGTRIQNSDNIKEETNKTIIGKDYSQFEVEEIAEDIKDEVINSHNFVNIHKLECENGLLSFELDEMYKKIENISLILKKEKKREYIQIELDKKISKQYIFDFSNYSQLLTNGKWELYCFLQMENTYVIGRLIYEDIANEPVEEKSNNIDEWKLPIVDSSTCLLYLKEDGRIYINVSSIENNFKARKSVSITMVDLKLKKDTYNLSFSVRGKNLVFGKSFLKLRNQTNDTVITSIASNIKEKSEGVYIFTAEYTIDWDNFFPLYWDCYLELFDDNEEKMNIKVNKSSKKLIKKIDQNYLKYAYTNKKEQMIIYPYVTLNRKNISFMMRKKEYYESSYYQLKESVAYFIYLALNKVYFSKKDIWIGFEKFSQTAQDNGYAFFDYVTKNELHKDFYYIIDKKSSDFKNIEKHSDKILKHMSLKYFIYLYAANLLVASETKRHAYNLRIRTGKLANTIQRKKSVFLQHGVTGLKRSNVFKKKKGRGNFNLVIATSENEKEIIHNEWLYNKNEIAVTGFSRWDFLKDKSSSVQKKKIFVMPTWRSWMEDMPKEAFTKTEYYKAYKEMLDSEKLKIMLTENKLELIFFLHPKFKEYASEFMGERENMKFYEFGELKVNNEIMESSLMISDYSSVTWDMLYLGKPIIFYQFDYDKYEEYEGSYIDMRNELFGDRVLNLEELLYNLEYYILNSFENKEKYKKMRQEYINYLDNQNSERIYKSIKKKFY